MYTRSLVIVLAGAKHAASGLCELMRTSLNSWTRNLFLSDDMWLWRFAGRWLQHTWRVIGCPFDAVFMQWKHSGCTVVRPKVYVLFEIVKQLIDTSIKYVCWLWLTTAAFEYCIDTYHVQLFGDLQVFIYILFTACKFSVFSDYVIVFGYSW